MKILLIITGSVGCYKALDFIRILQKQEIEFEVIATKNTFKFISKILIEGISKKIIYSEFIGNYNINTKHTIDLNQSSGTYIISLKSNDYTNEQLIIIE